MRLAQALVVVITCVGLSGTASGDERDAPTGQGDLFVHPFFSHMALADPVGEASFRFTGIQTKLDRERSEGDFGLHIEAGLIPNLGIHIRNDAVRHEPYSEVMLMYNVWVSEDERFGVSGFGQVSVPTGEEVGNTYKGLVGVGLRSAFPPLAVFNGDIHYDPKDDMAEYEGSFVFRASEMLYPILEARGEITEDATSVYLLPALKFRIRENQTIGAGFQIAVSDEREYDTEALLQYGVEY
jgi:hypothetical protein